MNNTFELPFRDFYHKLSKLNYKISTNTPLNAKYQNIKKYIEIIIPIFNRLLTSSDKCLTLDYILNDNNNNNNNNHNNNYDIDGNYMNKYLFQSNNEDIECIEDFEESVDEEGDILVNECSVKSSELLKKYCNNNWFSIEEYCTEEYYSD